MKSVLALCLLIVYVCGSTFDAEWAAFKTKYNRMYSGPIEEQRRYNIFKSNVEYAKTLSARDPHAIYGITQFMDLSREEFRTTILMNVSLPRSQPHQQHHERKSHGLRRQVAALPDSFDWKSKGAVTPVKDQGQCGSCWDFSATETIESVCFLAGYGLKTLSEQQILDCDKSDYGCNGGWPYNAFQYVVNAGGIESESDYPYSAQDGSCRFEPSKVACKLKSWKYAIQNKDETAMQNFVYNNSPVSVCVDAESWQFYSGGVITTSSNCGNSIDHCVQVTGWSVVDGIKAWNVRNSWGTSWGVNGYLYVQIGGDVCAIAEVVTVPCVTSTSNQVVC